MSHVFVGENHEAQSGGEEEIGRRSEAEKSQRELPEAVAKQTGIRGNSSGEEAQR